MNKIIIIILSVLLLMLMGCQKQEAHLFVGSVNEDMTSL
jgi:uncharacterized lipoprotein YehR (DUF1307 family)